MDPLVKFLEPISRLLIVTGFSLAISAHVEWEWFTGLWAYPTKDENGQSIGVIFAYQSLIGGAAALLGAYWAVVMPMQTEQKRRNNRKLNFRAHLAEVLGYIFMSEKIIFCDPQGSVEVNKHISDTRFVLGQLSGAISKYFDVYTLCLPAFIDDDHVNYFEISHINMNLSALRFKADKMVEFTAGKKFEDESFSGAIEAYKLLHKNLSDALEKIGDFLEMDESDFSDMNQILPQEMERLTLPAAR